MFFGKNIIVVDPIELDLMERYYKTGVIDAGDFNALAVKYIEEGADVASRYMRACEVDILAEQLGIA